MNRGVKGKYIAVHWTCSLDCGSQYMYVFCAKISENSQLHALKRWKANNKNDYREIICKEATWVWVEPTDGLLC
jgi:hypothetical protein